MYFNRENFGFTLAEVLITLGIIGVVAALTMPALITNYEKRKVSVKIKKAYSELSQTIKFAEAQNGDFNYWDFSLDSNIKTNTEKFIDKYFSPYLKLEKCEDNSNLKCGVRIGGNAINYLLPSGSSVSFHVHPNITDPNYKSIMTWIDTNGQQKPNMMGTDSFYFSIKNGKVLPVGWYDGITREDIFNGITDGEGNNFNCKPYTTNKDNVSNQRHGCTALLMIDNWEFKNDYPFKQKSVTEK